MNIKLVAFADGRFTHRIHQFRREAVKLNIFNEINIYTGKTLPEPFRTRHLQYMQKTKGFGYWLWKPIIIADVLNRANPSDMVIYMDIGFTINPSALTRFQEYIEIALDSQYKMLSFQHMFTECHYTKMDLAKRLGVENTPSVMYTSQLGAGFMFLCPTASNKKLIDDWYRISIESNYKYLDDSCSTNISDHKNFITHRHDQSIISILRKIHGTEITHYEVQSYANVFEKNKQNLPAWATRLTA